MNEERCKKCSDCRNRSDVVIDNFIYCYILGTRIWLLSKACCHFCDRDTGKSEDIF